MTAYLVTTPQNQSYDGKFFGLQFTSGKAVLSEETLNPLLGWTVEEILTLIRDYPGYEVRPLAGGRIREYGEETEASEEVDETGRGRQVSKADKKAKGKSKKS